MNADGVGKSLCLALSDCETQRNIAISVDAYRMFRLSGSIVSFYL